MRIFKLFKSNRKCEDAIDRERESIQKRKEALDEILRKMKGHSNGNYAGKDRRINPDDDYYDGPERRLSHA